MREIRMIKKQNSTFKLSVIASAIIATSLSGNLYAAQEDDKKKQQDEDIEVVIVQGTRSNLINAQNMKREAETVLDAISAKDIGDRKSVV